MFSRYFLLLVFFIPLNSHGQLAFTTEKSVKRLVDGFSEDFSQIIIPGNRIYVLKPDYSIGVSSYESDLIYEGISRVVSESKYNLVVQPFLKDHVVRKVYSSDSSFRIQHTSYMQENHASMRSIIDSLTSYGIDHFISTTIQRNEQNGLHVLNIKFVDTQSLTVKWSRTYYSDPRFKDKNTSTHLNIGILTSNPIQAEVFRDYGTNTSASLVGPYTDFVSYQNIYFQLDQTINDTWGASVFVGLSGIYLPEGFKDTLLGNNSLNIGFIELGTGIYGNFWPKKDASKNYWITLKQLASLGKPTVIDNILSTESRVEVHLTPTLSLFGSLKYFGPVTRSTLQYNEGLNFNTYMLCYGVFLSL